MRNEIKGERRKPSKFGIIFKAVFASELVAVYERAIRDVADSDPDLQRRMIGAVQKRMEQVTDEQGAIWPGIAGGLGPRQTRQVRKALVHFSRGFGSFFDRPTEVRE